MRVSLEPSMSRIVFGVITLISLTASAALGEADYLSKESLRQAGLAKFWQLRLPLDADQRIVNVYLVDDQLYCATNDGYVFALHAHTGAMRSIKKISDEAHRVKRPAHAGDRTIYLTDTVMTQVDRFTGDGIMRRDLGRVIGSAPVAYGALFYFGSVNQRFYAHDVYSGFEVWKVGTSGQISSRPAVSQGFLFVASHDGGVYACNAGNKRYHWVSRTRGPNSADLAIDENGLYVASEDHSLYQFDVGFGQIRWRVRFTGPLYDPPVLTPELAYQYSRDDGLAAIETGTIDVEKRVRWKIPRGLSLLTVDDKYAYVLTKGETILAVRIDNGQVDYRVAAPGFTMPIPSPGDATIYLADEFGRLFCGRSRSVPFLRREDVRAAVAARHPQAPQDAAVAAPVAPADDEIRNVLISRRTGLPVGGRSKVTKAFEKGGDDSP